VQSCLPDEVGACEIAWHLLRAEHSGRLRRRLHSLYSPSTANRL